MKNDNELIAEFMGFTFDEFGQCTDPEQKYSWRPGAYDTLRIEHLQYDNNWSWLMPVVEKINEACKETGYPDGMEICQWHIVAVAGNIKLVYFSVVEFIKWYNQQKGK